MDAWMGFAGAIIGGLVGGLFTYFGVKMTIKNENVKEQKKIQEKINEEKPRLDIVDFKKTNEKKDESCKSDCDVLFIKVKSYRSDSQRAYFSYDSLRFDKYNLCYCEYKFKNIGMTEIEDICVTTNINRDTSVIDFEKLYSYVDHETLPCEVWSRKRYIKRGDEVIFRIYYINDEILYSNLDGAMLTIWLFDVNGRIWKQFLHAPTNQIEISKMDKFSNFKELTSIENTIKFYFKDK